MKILKKSFVAIFALMLTFPMAAQDDVDGFLSAGLQDARVLSKAYLQPFGEMLGKSLNGGWYNTAKVHGVGGFDITLSVMATMTPSSKTSFDVSSLDLQDFEYVSGPKIAPNMAGEFEESMLPSLQPKTSGGEYAAFTLPNGAGFDILPAPMVQVGVGLPFHSEVMVRLIPKMDVGDVGSVGLYGFGLKHSLKDYIPFVKRVPFLQLSALVGYTNLKSNIPMEDSNPDNELVIASSALTSRLLIGANFPVISFYTGVGYGSATSDIDLNGEYEIGGSSSMQKDPLSLSYKINGLDFNAGMRIRLGFLSLHGDYTVGDYSTITAGVGINIR